MRGAIALLGLLAAVAVVAAGLLLPYLVCILFANALNGAVRWLTQCIWLLRWGAFLENCKCRRNAKEPIGPAVGFRFFSLV